MALDAFSLAALETIGLDAATLAALESISVQNFPADYPDAAVLAKVEAVRALLAATLTIAGTVAVSNFPASQPVSGTVALDGPTLAALEVIGLDAASLAALETISIANFPADYPDAAVLAKVEAVRALLAGTLTVGGTVGVGNFPATQAVTATDLDVRDLALTSDSVRQTQRAMSSYVAAQSSASGTVTAADVTAPTRIRLLRIDGGSKPSNTPTSFCTVTITLGTTDVFVKELQVGEPIGGQVCIEGAAGEDLKVTVTGTGTVQFNIRYETFT